MPRSLVCSAASLLVLAACPGGGGGTPDAADTVDVDCGDRLALSIRRPAGAGYLPLAQAADGAELVLGFQGFRYVYLRVTLDRDPGAISAAVVVQLDGAAARSQPVQLAFAPDGADVITPPLQVFFNDEPLPSLIDHGVALQLRLGPRCQASGHTVLRYDPSCYEGPDGQPVCAVADGAPDGGL